MLSYEMLHILPVFDMHDFAMLNLDNVLHVDKSQQIINQINSHIDAIKNIDNHKKIYAQREFSQTQKLNDNYINDLLNERYRPNMLGYKDLRKLNDHYYRYHKSIGSKYENKLIEHYNLLEDDYYTRLFLMFNTEI